MNSNAAVRDRVFWTLIAFVGDCWEWTGRRTTLNYGQVQRNGHRMGAHRRAYQLAVGPIPDGLEVRHRCDNPPCVRPEHLQLGTHADNMDDARSRGRNFIPSGSRNSHAKLTEASVRDARALLDQGFHPNVIAARLGVSRPTIYHIRAGRIWRHVAVAAPE